MGKTLVKAAAADVRVWAQAQNLDAGGSRGLLPQATIEAFNAAHKGSKIHRPGEVKPTTTVTFKNARNREVTRTVKVADVRAFVKARGGSARGRLAHQDVVDYVLSLPVKASKPSEA